MDGIIITNEKFEWKGRSSEFEIGEIGEEIGEYLKKSGSDGKKSGSDGKKTKEGYERYFNWDREIWLETSGTI
mgnify:CR=1 FL=1